MSQEKAQLIAPQGHFTVPGLNVAGVVTASSFSGNCTGTASSIAQGTNVVVGVMTASSFAGDVFGNAAGLSTTTAGLKLGIVTATSFAGNFTGIGSGLTGTPNIVAGLVTASQFVGNTPGLAAGISAGKNLAAGIITATTFYGDGSALTGAGSTAYIRQSVGSGTTIDLNNGNIILFNHVGDTTVSFANTSTADDVTFIRSLDPTDISISTGGVDFDGSGDFLSVPHSTDFQWNSQPWTLEYWVYADAFGTGSNGNTNMVGFSASASGAENWSFGAQADGTVEWYYWVGSQKRLTTTTAISTSKWNHLAFTYDGTTMTIWINGVSSATGSIDGTPTTIDDTITLTIGQVSTGQFNGKISNLRVVKGRALYNTDFEPPTKELTNVAQTVLLCCQSDSSTTTAAVIPTGSITANGDPTAGAQTVSLSLSLGSAITWPSSVTWNGGSAPTLLGSNLYSLSGQVFNLTTADGGSTWYGYEEVNNDAAGPRELWGWGRNHGGDVGANSAKPASISSPTQIPGTDWKELASKPGYTSYPSIASKTDGTVWVWGNGSNGDLGLNNTVSYSSPVQLPGTTWGTTKDTMAASSRGGLIIKTDGTLWSWGYNYSGQVGDNSTTQRSSPTQIPGTSWVKVFGGTGKSAAIRTDGSLWMWGNAYQGQLGLNQGGAGDVTVQSPTQIGSDTTWSTVSTGYYETFALKTDGTLWAWGNNGDGQLGQNVGGNPGDRSSPVQIPGTTWNYVRGGYEFGLATKTDGTLWMWGKNTSGVLGQNSTVDYSSPVQVPGTNWDGESLVGQGQNSAAALKTDGTLWAWGKGTWGVSGQNNLTDYSSPVQVPGSWGKLSGPLDLAGLYALTQAT